MKSLKIISAITFSALLLTVGNQPAISKALPDKSELGKGKYKFKNRNEKMAPLTMIKRQIKYGRTVAAAVSSTGSHDGKMYVVKRVYNPKGDKFSADIVYLTKKFRGGHSDVIKRFLIGYLEEMFNYDRPDARLLAQFILYYNGMFQGKIEKFQQDYLPEVTAELDPVKVGIKKSYKQWPGKAQIVIPLEKNILQEKGEKDVPVEEIVKETKPEMEKEIKQVESDQTATDDKKKKVVMYKIYLKKMEKFKIKKKKKEEVVIKKVIEEKKKEIQEIDDYLVSENLSDADKNKLKDKKDELEDDVNKLEKQADEQELSYNVIEGKIYVLKTNQFSSEHFENQMYIVDPSKDNAVLKSPYNKVCSRVFKVFKNHILVIGHHGGGEKHFLTLLRKSNLTVAKSGQHPVFWRSPMMIRGVNKDKLWVIEEHDNKYYLARYNEQLVRQAISNVPISRDSHLTFFNNKVYVTGQMNNKKEIQVFSKMDLKFLKVVDSY